jgi:multidrug efflux pump subunit AcrA (membrane-fusion protein)
MSVGRTVEPPLGSQDASSEIQQSLTDGAVDQQLLRDTQDEIRRNVGEIVRLSKGELSPGDFFAAFLQRVSAALASKAGVVWQVVEAGGCQVVAESNLHRSNLAEVVHSARHQSLLEAVAYAATPKALPPHTTTQQSLNPTDHLLLIVPVLVHGRVTAIVEVFQRSDRGLATERGYQRFLTEMAEIAGQYLAAHQMREMGLRQEFWNQLEGFLASIHRTLDVRQTSYAVVNEGRRLLECDRVSLALGQGRRCRIVAVSGLDSLDRRAQEVRLLTKLSSSVLRTGEPMWLSGSTEDLSPQLETCWHRYVDASHVRACTVLPLRTPQDDSCEPTRPFGALIVERLKDGQTGELHKARATSVAKHSAAALSKAVEHESLFLLPLWKLLGKTIAALGGRQYPKVLFAVIVLMAAAVALTCINSELALTAKGKLQPIVRETVFAGESGVIIDVPVEHGQTVAANSVLLQMRNTDLEVEITSLLGKRTTTQEQIVSVQRALLDNPRLDAEQQNRLSGELIQLKEVAANIERQLALVRQKEQQLVVRATQAGQVVTWHVRENLLHRPVQKGQALMAIVDPQGEWELEVYLPERKAGHLLEALQASDERLTVEFMLSSHPGLPLVGQIVEVDQTAVTREGFGNTVRVRVAVEKSQIPELRNDASVSAQIHCGERSLGYVWFHDLIDTVWGQLVYWF